jgi:PAS domain S-box-containing protein
LVEEQLRLSERRLTLAQSAAHLGEWEWDLRTNVIAISREYCEICGLAPDRRSLTCEEWLGLIHAEDRERVQVLVRDTVGRTHVWDAEFRVAWPDGIVHWLLGKGTVLLDDSGQPVRIAGVNLDITDRKQAEAALRATELQYREIFDNISVCMFLLDVTSDGRFKFASFNPAEEKVVGLSNADISGKFVEDVFADDLARKLTSNYRRCLEAVAPLLTTTNSTCQPDADTFIRTLSRCEMPPAAFT